MGACLRASFLNGKGADRRCSILMLGLAVAQIKGCALSRLHFVAINRCCLIESSTLLAQISAPPGWDCHSMVR